MAFDNGFRMILSLSLCLACGTAYTHEDKGVVPAGERAIAQEQAAQGPTQNIGIASVVRLGGVALASEFAGMEGKELRVREITILPGGVIAVHQHDARPGAAYILEGEIVEHRNDATSPITRVVGDIAFEKTGVTHWWENTSGAKVRALVVDIVDTPKP